MTVVSPYGTSVEAPGEPLPVGSLLAWHSDTPPPRYLMCNGAQVAIADYPRLYAVVGVKYGGLTDGSGGAGSTHFRLPDLAGKFLTSAASNLNVGSVGGSSTHQHTFTTDMTFDYAEGGSHDHAHTPGNLAAGGSHDHSGSYASDVNALPTNVKRATGGSTVRSFDIHTHVWATNTSAFSHGHTISNSSSDRVGATNHLHTVTYQNAAATVNDSPANVSHIPRHLAMNYVVYAGATP